MSVVFNKQKNKFYTKCEECRKLQKELETNNLQDGQYVYGPKNKRFYMNKNIPIQMCSIYTCFNKFPCLEHKNSKLSTCNGSKCNNCFIINGSNSCKRCIDENNKSKNKNRSLLYEFKKKLGGKCVKCNFNDLFLLECSYKEDKEKGNPISKSKPIHQPY
jgi:hypothetical protein